MEGGEVRGLPEEDGDSEGGETLAGSYLVAALRGGATLTENNTLYLLHLNTYIQYCTCYTGFNHKLPWTYFTQLY